MPLLEMGIAMMKPTMQLAIMMVVIAVSLMSIHTIAQSAYAITRRPVQLELIIWLVMDTAMMKPTMQTAIMMVETVVALV